MAKLSTVIFLLVAVCYSQAEDSAIIEVPGGKIKGKFRENYYEFKSIPYAEPPIGERRFEPSQQYNSTWEGIRDATQYSSPCLQWDEFSLGKDLLNGEEDCLYLNVFTPSIDGEETYPVIVHIHGGAFMFGSGLLYGPERLLKQNKLVVVTLNYRLGPLGFLSTGDDQISGNMGLKDQLMAIKWVNKNIHIFKGNPQNITLSGFSAGAASVHFHLLSKQSQGLYSAAISHSGSVFCAWVLIRNPLERAKQLANLLNCPTDDTATLKGCLKQKDGKDIVRAIQYFQPFLYNPFTVFGPVIETISSTNGFITEDFEKIIKEGRSAKVPWVVSFTQDEGGYNAAALMQKDKNGKDLIDSFNENWSKLAPLILFYNETVPADEHAAYAETLKKRYLGDEEFSSKTYRKLQDMYSDELFLKGIEKSIKLHTTFSEAPVFIYHYNKTLPGGAGPLMSRRSDFDFGTVHGDDVYLIFNNPLILPTYFTEKEYEMSKNFADLYESLAKTGVPTFKNIIIPENSGPSKELKVLLINSVDDYTIEKLNR